MSTEDADKPRQALLDRLIEAYRAMLRRPDRPVIPPPPDPAEYVPDLSPPTPEERARAEAAARETIRRLNSES